MEMCFGDPERTAAIDLAADRMPDMNSRLGAVTTNTHETASIFEIADFV